MRVMQNVAARTAASTDPNGPSRARNNQPSVSMKLLKGGEIKAHFSVQFTRQ